MLKKILSPDVCKNCKICCSFIAEDVYEAPEFCEEAVRKIKHIKPYVEFEKKTKKNKTYYKAVYNFKDEKEILLCPALVADKGCILDEALKPSECKLWPVRAFNGINGIDIGISQMCEELNRNDCGKVRQLLEAGLANDIVKLLETEELDVKNDKTGYKILIKDLQ